MLTLCLSQPTITQRITPRPTRLSSDCLTPTMRCCWHCRRWLTSMVWRHTPRVSLTVPRHHSRSLWQRERMQNTMRWRRSGLVRWLLPEAKMVLRYNDTATSSVVLQRVRRSMLWLTTIWATATSTTRIWSRQPSRLIPSSRSMASVMRSVPMQ